MNWINKIFETIKGSEDLSDIKSSTLRDIINGNILTKEYNRASSQDSVTRPDIHDLEVLLNEQLSEIMAQALSDNQIRGAIKGQF